MGKRVRILLSTLALGALLGSAFDAYGQLDSASARVWLTRISVPADTPHVDSLQQRLARA